MCSYFCYKTFIFDELIIGFLINGDALEKALGLVGTIVFSIIGLVFIALDILAIPLYLIIGILAIIFKIIEIIKDKFWG